MVSRMRVRDSRIRVSISTLAPLLRSVRTEDPLKYNFTRLCAKQLSTNTICAQSNANLFHREWHANAVFLHKHGSTI